MTIPRIESSDLMLATVRRHPFSNPDWLYEWKYDGYRILVRRAGERVELLSRLGNPLNASFPDIVAAVATVRMSFIWDAELTVDIDGLPSFARVQARAKTTSAKNVPAMARQYPARLYAFDMLASGDRDLRGLSLMERKRHLRDSFVDTGVIVFVNGVIGAGRQVFELVQSYGFEGMLCKRLASTYQKGRSRDWLKVKHAGYER